MSASFPDVHISSLLCQIQSIYLLGALFDGNTDTGKGAPLCKTQIETFRNTHHKTKTTLRSSCHEPFPNEQ